MAELVTAHVALWILIAALGGLVLLLSRQVGRLYAQVAPAGALAVNAVLEVGMPGPEFEVCTLDGVLRRLGGGSQLLLFVAPDCPISRSLVPVLGSLAHSEPGVQVLLVSDGEDEAAHRAFAGQRALRGLDYVLSEAAGRAYGVSKLPYAVLLNEHGLVAGLGIVNSREHLESLFEARDRGVASIQEFMAKSGQFRPADGAA